jgi:hypothetical protein
MLCYFSANANKRERVKIDLGIYPKRLKTMVGPDVPSSPPPRITSLLD